MPKSKYPVRKFTDCQLFTERFKALAVILLETHVTQTRLRTVNMTALRRESVTDGRARENLYPPPPTKKKKKEKKKVVVS